MKTDPPEMDAPAVEWQQYAVQVHQCVEDGRDENRAAFSSARRAVRVNLVALLTLILATTVAAGSILNYAANALRWGDGVDARLADLALAGAGRDKRLDNIDGRLSDLAEPPRKDHR